MVGWVGPQVHLLGRGGVLARVVPPLRRHRVQTAVRGSWNIFISIYLKVFWLITLLLFHRGNAPLYRGSLYLTSLLFFQRSVPHPRDAGRRFEPSSGIFKLLRSLAFDSKKSIPPAYVAWRAGTTTRQPYSYSVLSPRSIVLKFQCWTLSTLYRQWQIQREGERGCERVQVAISGLSCWGGGRGGNVTRVEGAR